jgi:hypothetical protein
MRAIWRQRPKFYSSSPPVSKFTASNSILTLAHFLSQCSFNSILISGTFAYVFSLRHTINLTSDPHSPTCSHFDTINLISDPNSPTCFHFDTRSISPATLIRQRAHFDTINLISDPNSPTCTHHDTINHTSERPTFAFLLMRTKPPYHLLPLQVWTPQKTQGRTMPRTSFCSLQFVLFTAKSLQTQGRTPHGPIRHVLWALAPLNRNAFVGSTLYFHRTEYTDPFCLTLCT